jgi:ParB-like chromosome segregation protein Spo0J
MHQNLPTDRITIRDDARVINAESVQGLADSIAAVGLINPIRVRVTGEGWEVIAGAHRLEACRSLGLVEIAADVVEDDDLHAELAMIDENLCRAELSPADRAKQTARRKVVYLQLHPETGQGKANTREVQSVAHADRTPAFVDATAALTGRSKSAVAADVDRGNKVLDEVVELIRGTTLDTGTYLDKLAKMPGNEQFKAATRDLAFANQRQRQDDKAKTEAAKRTKIQGDVKARAAKEVASIIAEHVPGEWWDAVKANLYASGAANIAHELTNITGQSVIDRGAA